MIIIIYIQKYFPRQIMPNYEHENVILSLVVISLRLKLNLNHQYNNYKKNNGRNFHGTLSPFPRSKYKCNKACNL